MLENTAISEALPPEDARSARCCWSQSQPGQAPDALAYQISTKSGSAYSWAIDDSTNFCRLVSSGNLAAIVFQSWADSNCAKFD